MRTHARSLVLARLAVTFGAALGACLVVAMAGPAFGEWQTFTIADGLGDNSVTKVLEDRAGNLWFATNSGVSRYDGASWRTFTIADGLGENLVGAMLEDRAGNLWCATNNGGVNRYDGSTWRNFTNADGLLHNSVHAIFEDRAGNLWFSTSLGVSRYDGSSWRNFADGQGSNALSILEDRAGNLWFLSDAGWLRRYDGESWRHFTTADGLADDYVISIMKDRAGNLWFGTNRGATRYDGASWRTFTTADGLAGDDMVFMFEDRVGNLWFATDGGVSRYDGASWRTMITTDRLAGGIVTSILEDHAGKLWCSLFWFPPHPDVVPGVVRYDGSTWRAFTTADGLAGTTVFTVLEDRVGNLWFGTDGGVSRHDGASWRTFTAAEGVGGMATGAVLEDHAGNMWFAMTGGVSRYGGSTWRTFTTADGLASNEVTCMHTDRAGNVWLGTPGSLSRYDGSTWKTFPAVGPHGWPYYVVDIVEDHAGNLWFATTCGDCYNGGGVIRYDGATWRTFTTADGLASNQMYCAFVDRTGNLWFGTELGVSRYDGSTWRTFDYADGVVGTHTIFEDRAGNLWFLGGAGHVTRYDGSTFRVFEPPDGLGLYPNAILEDHAGNLWFMDRNPAEGEVAFLSRYDGSTWRTFTTADGLPSNFVSTLFVDRAGDLWLGTQAGLVRYNGSTWRTFTNADGLSSNYVSAVHEDRGGNLWIPGSGVTRYEPDRVPPRTVFRSAPSALSPSRHQSAVFAAAFGERRIEFSSRFDGGPWSNWSTLDSWVGNDLPDGIHALEVRSRDFLTNALPTPVVATFEVDATPPAPVISAPLFGLPVRGNVEIRGVAADARFQSFRVETRPAGTISWSPPLAQSSTPVTDGRLATWDTSSLPDGNYDIRLSVSDALGLSGSALTTVIVDNQAPYADVTAPATVSATGGGDLYTTHSELHLYFPPHAFDQDARVTIATDPAPDALPSGATRVQPGYAIGWGSALLKKGATLEFSTAGRAAAPGTLAIYCSPDGSNWRRLGGTSEGGKASLVVREPGRYALYAETAVTEGAATLSELSFAPRVFSPRGTFANDHLAIGFTLGRSSSVTVRVYNRAGRLVQEVVAGQAFGAGANLVRWNGRDREGQLVPDGPYVVTVEALGQTRRSPLAVVR